MSGELTFLANHKAIGTKFQSKCAKTTTMLAFPFEVPILHLQSDGFYSRPAASRLEAIATMLLTPCTSIMERHGVPRWMGRNEGLS